MNAHQFWSGMLEPEDAYQGPMLAEALIKLAVVHPEALERAVQRLERTQQALPVLSPAAFRDPVIWTNAERLHAVLVAACKLRAAIHALGEAPKPRIIVPG